MKKIEAKHIDDLALGSVFLATGGGGDPYLPQQIAKKVLESCGPVQTILPQTQNLSLDRPFGLSQLCASCHIPSAATIHRRASKLSTVVTFLSV